MKSNALTRIFSATILIEPKLRRTLCSGREPSSMSLFLFLRPRSSAVRCGPAFCFAGGFKSARGRPSPFSLLSLPFCRAPAKSRALRSPACFSKLRPGRSAPAVPHKVPAQGGFSIDKNGFICNNCCTTLVAYNKKEETADAAETKNNKRHDFKHRLENYTGNGV